MPRILADALPASTACFPHLLAANLETVTSTMANVTVRRGGPALIVSLLNAIHWLMETVGGRDRKESLASARMDGEELTVMFVRMITPVLGFPLLAG